MVVGVGYLGPDDFDDLGAGFDQAAGQQAALAEGVAAVQVADRGRFFLKLEGIASAARDDQGESPVVIFGEFEVGDGLVDDGHAGVQGFAKLGAAPEPHGEHLGPELEVVDLDLVHLRHVHVVAIGVKRVRIVGLTEEPGGSSLADDSAFLQRTRQHDEREHRLRRGLQLDELGTEVREIFGTGWLKLARRADFVGRVARHHLIDRRGVVEQSVGRVAHRADKRELVGNLGKLRQDFGYLDAWSLGCDGLEDASDVIRHIFLWVPQVEMAGPSLKIDHDDALGLTPAGPSVCFRRPCRHRLQLEHRAQAETEQPGPADAENIAPCDTSCASQRSFPGRPGTMIIVSLQQRFRRAKYLAGRKPGGLIGKFKQLLYRAGGVLSSQKSRRFWSFVVIRMLGLDYLSDKPICRTSRAKCSIARHALAICMSHDVSQSWDSLASYQGIDGRRDAFQDGWPAATHSLEDFFPERRIEVKS